MPHLPNLKRIRESQLMTQRELAEKAGVKIVTISRIENGRHQAMFSTVKALAGALGVDAAELMEPSP